MVFFMGVDSVGQYKPIVFGKQTLEGIRPKKLMKRRHKSQIKQEKHIQKHTREMGAKLDDVVVVAF